MISLGSLGTAVMRMAAENAVESSETNRLIIRAGGDRKKAAIETDIANKEAAAGVQQAQGYYQIGMAVVGAAKSAKGAVDAGQNLANRVETENNLSATTDAARANPEASQESIDAIRNTTYEGVKLGDRFSDAQVRELVRGDFTPESLREAGFSESEVGELMNMQREGGSFSTDDAVKFMYDHRYTPEQQAENARQEALAKGGVSADTYKAVTSTLGLAVNGVFDQSKSNMQEGGRKAKEDLAKAEEMRKELAGATFEHNRELGRIELQMIKGKAGANGKR